MHNSNFIDLSGQQFGRLYVLFRYFYRFDQPKVTFWYCICSCGNRVIRGAQHLKNPNVKNPSCGCFVSERAQENHAIVYTKKTRFGENNPNWKKDTKTPLHAAIRRSFKYCKWRDLIFRLAGFKCQHCEDKTGGNLRAHHILKFSTIMENYKIKSLEEALSCEILWDLGNGLCLCEDCHKKVHEVIK